MKSILLGVLLGLTSRVNAGFSGIDGVLDYTPVCAHACRAVIGGAPLECSGTGYGGAHAHGAPPTSPDCRSTNLPFLTTLAFCLKAKCQTVVPWELEKYWGEYATGSPAVPPKWPLYQTLDMITTPPNSTYIYGSTLNKTMLVSETSYGIQEKFWTVFRQDGVNMNVYTIAIVVVGFLTPIAVTVFTKIPFVPAILDKLKPYLVYPSTVGTFHVRSLPFSIGNPPTMGQGLYIAMFVIVNLVLTFVSYDSAQPHPWGYDKRGELLAYLGYRTGSIAFALLPLTILFSGRNNFLLWVTNWSHSTYLLLHRWVARIFAFHTILHSIFLLLAYQQSGIYELNMVEPYWLWGIVGTVFVCAMLVFGLLWFRRLAYEIFLITHIVMAVFVIAGSWYHLYYRFGLGGNFEYWLYAACAVWFFDRLLRVGKIIHNGVRRATVTEVGSTHVRIDVPGVRWGSKPGYHAYAHFPMLSLLRPWENHPFSVNSTAIFRGTPQTAVATPDRRSSDDARDVEKSVAHATAVQHTATAASPGQTGVTFIVRKSTGITRFLQKHAALLTLIDGPYQNTSSDAILKCDRVLLIGGGIGITGLLSWANQHPNIKFAWSVKAADRALVQEVDGVLRGCADKQVLVGQRLAVKELLAEEVRAGWARIGVVVCGPGGLCDDVRAEVARLGRKEKAVFELEVDAYSW